ncbi:MAG: ABC transporter substrate-binding protein [Candidatus Eremiobacteraeota bacterium]|nr:ABC transporter substrate-binding protein [Candidatus Eremiobacteraeota bacterium]
MTPRRTLLSALAAVALMMCGTPAIPAEPDAPASVTIAYQPGVGYGTLIVVKQLGLLERRFPHTKFDWRVLTNGDAIRDGIIAGQIQIGAGGNGPFLIGWDRGVGYKLIAPMNVMNLWMVARADEPNIRSLRDIPPGAKIGMPSPDAVQAIALRKAAQEMFGDAHKFDANIVAIQHPLGVQAMAAKQLDLHLSAPPFQQQEVDAGGHVVFRSFLAFGRSTFNSVYTTETFAKRYPMLVQTLFDGLRTATNMLNRDPDQAASLLSKDTGGQTPATRFKAWITGSDVSWDMTPHAFLRTAAFMKEIGMMNRVPAGIRELELPQLKGAGD